MPFYRYTLRVPEALPVVRERLANLIGDPSAPGTAPFSGVLYENEFRVRRTISSGGSLVPRIRGKLRQDGQGTRVTVGMSVAPVLVFFMLLWLVGFGYRAWLAWRAQSAELAVPLIMAPLGLALSLTRFFLEARRQRALLTAGLVGQRISRAAGPAPATTPRRRFPLRRFLLAVGVALCVLFLVMPAGQQYRLQNSPLRAAALQLANASENARGALGPPIQPGLFVDGVIRDDMRAGYALLSLPVAGTKAQGRLYAIAHRTLRGWPLERLALRTGEQRLDLTPRAEGADFDYPARGTVYLVPLDNEASQLVRDFCPYFATRLKADVKNEPVISLPSAAIDSHTRQVIAEDAIEFLKNAEQKRAEDPDAAFVAITSQDLNIRTANWRYTINYRAGRFAIVSTARLHNMPWFTGTNPEAAVVRARKLVLKNLLLVHYPVALSSDPTSVLANSVFTSDQADQMTEDVLGERGSWSPIPGALPCVSIVQAPGQKQTWTLNCFDEPPADSRFEVFTHSPSNAIFSVARTDFPFQAEPLLSFVRKMRSHDARSRSFGIGGNDSYDIFPVGDSQTFSYIDLIREDGRRVEFRRTSFDTGFADARYASNTYAGDPFGQSHLVWNGNGWSLTTSNHWIFKFPDSGPERTPEESALERVDTGSGSLVLTRTAAGNLVGAQLPDGSHVDFRSDAANRLVAAQHSNGHSIAYDYDANGRLVHLRDSETGSESYRYDARGQLLEVLDSSGRTLLANTYDEFGEIVRQTLADGRVLRYEYGYDAEQRIASLRFRDDRGYTIRWMRGRGGFYPSLPHLARQ